MINQTDDELKNWKWIRIVLLILSVGYIVFLLPNGSGFKYDIQLGKVWKHENLKAPFSYAIQKDKTLYDKELKEVMENYHPYVHRDSTSERVLREGFSTKLQSVLEVESKIDKFEILNTKGTEILQGIFKKGIVEPKILSIAGEDKLVYLVESGFYEDRKLNEFYTLDQVKSYIRNIHSINEEEDKIIAKSIFGIISPNIIYDSTLSNTKRNELMESVSMYSGLVKENETIIANGNIIDKNNFQKLSSLKSAYEKNIDSMEDDYLNLVGNLLIVLILSLIFALQIIFNNKEVFDKPRALLALMFLILLTLTATSVFTEYKIFSVYLIPYCTIPILLLAFFKQRIAFAAHLFTVFIAALIVENPFEFIMIQIPAGIVSVISMSKIRFLSQFFISTIFLFLTYCISFFAFSLLHISSISEIPYDEFIWFGGNFVFTLLTYPLIYANEKVFGLVSDISLLEWNDVNNKLLKQLSVEAPGTFQHSLQVANISEAVISELGGNALLTRVGALYHDIGKLKKPGFFTENQVSGKNPLNDFPEDQSAAIIIEHVTYGEELANENKLPERIIDFINTHHGTTRVEYFFRKFQEKHPNEVIDEGVFRYTGPKPFSKETAVVMIVDSIEAAAHSLSNPDEESLERLTDKIIDFKIDERQFSEAPITLQEIEITRKIVKRLLKSIYHARIKYPGQE